MRGGGERAALALVVVTAGALRFAGIAHGLARGGPEFDERMNFVDPILRMWEKRSPDPQVYAGYPGFFNYVAFVPVGIGQSLAGETGAYAAARGVTALSGMASVLLAYLVVRGLGGPEPALLAATLLAFSRIEVRSAHYVTADVLVGCLILGVLLMIGSGQRRGDVAAGALAGIASAVKYTGLLAVPGLVAGLAAGRRLRRSLLPAAVAGLVAFALAAPYALVRRGEQGTGFQTGLEGYYGPEPARQVISGQVGSLGTVLGSLWLDLGPVGSALALLSLPLARRRAAVVPALAVAGTALVVMAPANVLNPRHIIPAAAATTVLAGAGCASILDRLRPGPMRALVAGLLAVAALAPPAAGSIRLIRRYRTPSAVDRAAVWLEANVPGPARIVTSLARLRLDRRRFEVRSIPSLRGLPHGVLGHYDLALSSTRSEAAALAGTAVARFVADAEDAERTLTLFRPTEHEPLAAAPSARLPAGGDLEGGSLFEAVWEQPIAVVRVEVEVGDRPEDWPLRLTLLGSPGGTAWEALAVVPLRPTRPHNQREGAPHGQIYVLAPPRTLRALRIVPDEGSPVRSEVRVQVLAEAASGR